MYIDDILITGATEADHLLALEQVLDRLEKAGLRIKKKKCRFMSPSVSYLGYKIDAEGIHPLEDKVHAVKDAPQPKSVQKLKSYLGLLSYYSKFMPNLSTAPLCGLLKKEVKWMWSEAEDIAFCKSKELLTSTKVLVHFNPKHKLVLACDASAYGIGAVLAHKFPDGSERPIAYASRSLAPAERSVGERGFSLHLWCKVFSRLPLRPHVRADYGSQTTPSAVGRAQAYLVASFSSG